MRRASAPLKGVPHVEQPLSVGLYHYAHVVTRAQRPLQKYLQKYRDCYEIGKDVIMLPSFSQHVAACSASGTFEQPESCSVIGLLA